MQSLMLLGWLAAAAAEPVVIEVPTQALATVDAPKRHRSATDLVAQAAHAMSARMGADGRIHYHCADATATHDFRVDARAPRKEK
jgi:hypothetical protein